MNVVGYKGAFWTSSSVYCLSFYMNVVGYKVTWLSPDTKLGGVLYERSGI